MTKKLFLIAVIGMVGIILFRSANAMGGGWITDTNTLDRVDTICRDGYRATQVQFNPKNDPVNNIRPLSFGQPVDSAWYTQETEGVIDPELSDPLLFPEYYQKLGPRLSLDSYGTLVEKSIEVSKTIYDEYYVTDYSFSRHMPVGSHIAFWHGTGSNIFDIRMVEDCFLHTLNGDVDQQIDTQKFIDPGYDYIASKDLTVEIIDVPQGGTMTFGLEDLSSGSTFPLSATELWGMNYVASENPPAQDSLTFSVRGTYRVSLDSEGDQITSGASYDPSISADGSKISFTSLGNNIVTIQDDVTTNSASDIYIRTLKISSNQTELVSRNKTNQAGNGGSFDSYISPDGKSVTYVSSASDLVTSENILFCEFYKDTNGAFDVFKWEGTTSTRVSMFNFNSDCEEITEISTFPSIADTRSSKAVAFQTLGDFYPVDNDVNDILLDVDGTSNRIYQAKGILLRAPDGRSYAADISADGNFVAFTTDATNLFSSDTNDNTDVGVKDLNGNVTRVSVASDGAQAEGGDSIRPSISHIGQHIAFQSTATNLSNAEYNNNSQIYVHDTGTGCTQLLTKSLFSLLPEGSMANGASTRAQISADGRFVAFVSTATNLVTNDTNEVSDIFLVDRDFDQDHSFYAQKGSCAPGPMRVTRVSIAGDGTEANGASFDPAISNNGDFIAFASDATNLINGDTNGLRDVYVHYRGYEGEIRFATKTIIVDSCLFNTCAYLPIATQP